MKPARWVLALFLAVVLTSGTWGVAHATPPPPRTPPSPPIPLPLLLPGAEIGALSQPAPRVGGTHEGVPEQVPTGLSRVPDLPQLKAVLLVGPIDGNYGPQTTREKANMDLAAAELEANGITIFKFYTPENDWAQIRAAAEGAHFLFYRGHGVYQGSMPSPTVGGFFLNDGFISSEDIRTGLKLAPNAIVMLYGCFTAGSSSIEGDSIGSTEAQRRVAQYSAPLLEIGAAGYYANWFGDAFQLFVRYLFRGMTLGQAYESFYDFNHTTVERHTDPDDSGLVIWLDKDYMRRHWQYDNAFVGLPEQTLVGLFSEKAYGIYLPVIAAAAR